MGQRRAKAHDKRTNCDLFVRTRVHDSAIGTAHHRAALM
jgi:hypothetical protein